MFFEGGNIHLDDYIVIYTCIHVYYGFPDASVVKKICLPMHETWVWSLGLEDPPVKEMATHPSILKRETSWTEQPAVYLQSRGHKRVRQDLKTKQHQQNMCVCAHTHTHMLIHKTLAPWKKSYDKPRQCVLKQRHYFVNKGLYSQSYGFFSSHVWMSVGP